MQTFLPFESFEDSALSLDSRRLNKQAVECYQIGLILWRKKSWIPNPFNKKGFWNHPAVRMWQNYELSFLDYFEAIITECAVRKIKVNKHWQNWEYLNTSIPALTVQPSLPRWLNSALTLSHQSNLVRKDSAFYSPKFPDVPNNLPYVWPV